MHMHTVTVAYFVYTTFIRINTQPQISAHLKQEPILMAKKANKCRALNKPPSPPLPLKNTWYEVKAVFFFFVLLMEDKLTGTVCLKMVKI